MLLVNVLLILFSNANVIKNGTDEAFDSKQIIRQVNKEYYGYSINNDNQIKPSTKEDGENEEKPIAGAAFGGSLYLCSFISSDGNSCKFISHPEQYYVFLENEFIKITGQLRPSIENNQRPVLSTINMEFFDEQKRTSAVYSRSLNNLFPSTCESDSPVHYRFLDDNSKEIRLIECSSSNSAYLLNDRRQIYIAIVPTTQGLWLSVNICKDLVDKSRGILPEGISASLVEDMISFDKDSVPEYEIEQCYIRSYAESGVKLPESVIDSRDFSTQLRKICIDSIRRGLKEMASIKQFNQINQHTSVFNQHFAHQLPLYLSKLETSHQPAYPHTVLPGSSDSNAPYHLRQFNGQCTCVESLYPNYLRSDSDHDTVLPTPVKNRSSTLIYPHSMMIVEWRNGTNDVLMKGVIHPTQTNFTKPIEIETTQQLINGLDNNYPNYIVRYNSDGARITRLRRNFVDNNILLSKGDNADDEVQIDEINFIDWVQDENQKNLMCSLANKLKPNRLFMSLRPKRYLHCDGDCKNATISDCEHNECFGSYSLLISL